MPNYTTIDEIVKDDYIWRKHAFQITKGNSFLADELVHTFYLKYLQLKVPIPINKSYVIKSLRNILIDEFKLDNNKNDDVHNIRIEQDHYDYDSSDDNYNEILYSKIIKDIEELNFFDKTLFKMNMVDGKSIRKIQKETSLSFSSIQKSITKTKLYLKNKYTEDATKKD